MEFTSVAVIPFFNHFKLIRSKNKEHLPATGMTMKLSEQDGLKESFAFEIRVGMSMDDDVLHAAPATVRTKSALAQLLSIGSFGSEARS